jgi:hypothetical protein
LLIILTVFILIKHYDPKMTIAEKLILIMIFILITYTAYSYYQLEGYTDFSTAIATATAASTTDPFAATTSPDISSILKASPHRPAKFSNVTPKSPMETAISTLPTPSDGKKTSIFNPSIIIGNDKQTRKYRTDLDEYDDETDSHNTGNGMEYIDYNKLRNAAIYKPGADDRDRDRDIYYMSDVSQEMAKYGKGLDGKPLLAFPKNKLYLPGFQYVDPVRWDVPQRKLPAAVGGHTPAPPSYPPAGIVSTNFSYLEYNEMGKQAMTESDVKHSNVGSILPKFEYKILPYATP